MIEIIRDLKAGKPLIISTGRGKRARLPADQHLINLLSNAVREGALAQLNALDALESRTLVVKLEGPRQPEQEPPQPAIVPITKAGEAPGTVVPSEAGALVNAYFKHANDHKLKCWYVSHFMREELIAKSWEEIEVEGTHRLKVCDLPVYPIHSFTGDFSMVVAEGKGWKLAAHK